MGSAGVALMGSAGVALRGVAGVARSGAPGDGEGGLSGGWPRVGLSVGCGALSLGAAGVRGAEGAAPGALRSPSPAQAASVAAASSNSPATVTFMRLGFTCRSSRRL